MAKRFLHSANQSIRVRFREVSVELLSDFLINLNKRNKDKLASLSKCSGCFKNKELMEYIFLIVEMLRLDPLVGYHATEILERFMIRHLEDLFTAATSQDAAAGNLPGNYEDVAFEKLREKFPLIVFSCVQLASKLSWRSNIIDNNAAVQFLHTLGHSVSKQTLLESELMILNGLEFRLNAPNPLAYVEILLEVLGHNESSIPMEDLHHLCRHVLQFISLQRAAIYDSLLVATTQCQSPSSEQREKFATVTEDCMLLGVGVIAVAAYILNHDDWDQVAKELSYITRISQRSLRDFTHVTLMHITGARV